MTLDLEKQVASAVEAFEGMFGRRPRFVATAPGRVNLIGEHTDYNNGYVLPMAINRWALIVAEKVAAPPSTLWAVDLDEVFEADFSRPSAPPSGSFAGYLLSVAHQFANAGHKVPNLNLVLTSTVPIGAGLGSSAAVGVAMATLLDHLLDARLDPVERAVLSQRAEHGFPNTPCGIMDMLTATCAKEGHALLIDCLPNTARPIPMPPGRQVTVLIADTGRRHLLARSGYADRRQTCQSAARRLGVGSLREAALGMLPDAGLSELQRRCAHHVILENQRTLLAAAALKTGDLKTLGELMFDGHASLRDGFGVSCPELDCLVDAAADHRGPGGVIGARMTGGGFGGCCVALCKTEAVESVSSELRHQFVDHFGRAPEIFAVTATGPAGMIGDWRERIADS